MDETENESQEIAQKLQQIDHTCECKATRNRVRSHATIVDPVLTLLS